MDWISEGHHVIGAFVGRATGPTLIVIGSIHGNEIGGAKALSKLSHDIADITTKLNGRVYFLAGNTRAIAKGVRYTDADLNRHWTRHNMSNIGSDEMAKSAEGRELVELDRILDSILITAEDEVYVLDLHSTSADGMPFATVGDTLRNRKFAQGFPVTILLGIEEQLEGTMLEYLNNAGAVTLGFEGGQHFSNQTVENHEALVWLALVNSKILKASDVPYLSKFQDRLAQGNSRSRVFEVRYRHAISKADEFEMKPGFNNFDPIIKGQPLGRDKNGVLTAAETGMILMPLYQKLGEDGYFIGREISPFWLGLSEILRRLGFQNLIRVLPGVSRDPANQDDLIVNTRIARILPLQVFHLLGYRRRRWSGHKLIVSRRRHDTDSPFVNRRP